MIDATYRQKRRAAKATIGSLLAFLLFMAGIQVAGRVQYAAGDRDPDVRAVVSQLSLSTSISDGAARFRAIQWEEFGVQGAAWFDANCRLQATSPEAREWYGCTTSQILAYPPVMGFGMPMPPGAPPGMMGGPPGYGGPPGMVGGPIPMPGGYMPPGPGGAPFTPARMPDPRTVSPMQIEEQMRQILNVGTLPVYLKLLSADLATTNGEPLGRLLYFARPDMGRYTLARTAEVLFGFGALLSAILYWCFLPWWVYLDARGRTTRAVPLALFVGLTNFLGWITYLVIRPDGEQICPACALPLLSEYRLCPRCGYSEGARCHQCGRPARLDWRFCPYCETPRPESSLVPGS